MAPPLFAHVPLILGEDKARLSKRHGATAVQHYRNAGFLPQAMVNFLARLGWSHGDEEIFTVTELIEKFDLANVGKAAGVFNEEKLLWLNHHYLRQLPAEKLEAAITPFVESAFGKPALTRLRSPEWRKLLPELTERCKTLPEYASSAGFYFSDQAVYEPAAAAEYLRPELLQPLSRLRQALSLCSPFTETTIEQTFKQVLEESGVKLKAMAQAVRLALTGSTVSPGIYLLIAVVGKERTLTRLDQAIDMLRRTRT
jgi:glutamyl-tRNA synthetase